MPNDLSWDEAEPGTTHELPILVYSPKHTVPRLPWVDDKWDAIEARYDNPLQPDLYPTQMCCDICGRLASVSDDGPVTVHWGRCAYCARSEARHEQQATKHGRTMASTRVQSPHR